MSVPRFYFYVVGLGWTAAASVAGADWLFVLGSHRSSPQLVYALAALTATWWLGYFGWTR